MGYILSESEFRETVAFEMVNRLGFKKIGNKSTATPKRGDLNGDPKRAQIFKQNKFE